MFGTGFIWHPAFKELRDYVLAHPTHPDDITVSMIISHVSGRAPRVYSRNMHKRNALSKVLVNDELKDINAPISNTVMLPPRSSLSDHRRLSLNEKGIDSDRWLKDRIIYEEANSARMVQKEGRRNLLWNKEEWPLLREDALNSITGYFGSFNGGSVGWCLTTIFHTKTDEGLHWCESEISSLDWSPWVNEGRLGYNECALPRYATEISDSDKEYLFSLPTPNHIFDGAMQ